MLFIKVATVVVDDLRGVSLNASSFITSKRIINIAGPTLVFLSAIVLAGNDTRQESRFGHIITRLDNPSITLANYAVLILPEVSIINVTMNLSLGITYPFDRNNTDIFR